MGDAVVHGVGHADAEWMGMCIMVCCGGKVDQHSGWMEVS